MKKKLLVLFGVIACGLYSYAQTPENIYYQFEDSVSISNYASDPVGLTPVSIDSPLTTAPGGFLNSDALYGNGGAQSGGGVLTGWNTVVQGSFSVAFMFDNSTAQADFGSYIFGDSAAALHCYLRSSGGTLILFLDIPGRDQVLSPLGASNQSHMIHIVYNEDPAVPMSSFGGAYVPSGNAGSLTVYIDGQPLPFGAELVEELISFRGDGLVVGRNPGMINFNPFVPFNLEGKLDEFRWYDRALTATEVQNTWNVELNPAGSCDLYSGFKIDSISGEGARIGWDPGTSNSSFFIEYDTTGFFRGTGITVSGNYPLSQPPVVISGLTPETEYDVYFGEICGNDSIYNPEPYTFRTRKPCPAILQSTFSVSGVTQTTAELTWEYAGNSEEFYVIYGSSGFDPFSAVQTDTVTGTSHIMNGLAPATYYDVYLVVNCGTTNGVSDTISQTFVTLCDIKSAPYFENFDDTTWVAGSGNNNDGSRLNPCWSSSSFPSSEAAWQTRTGNASVSSAPDKDVSGSGNYIYLKGNNGSTGDNVILTSPRIDISSLSQPYLSFYFYRYDNNGRPHPDIIVEGNDGSGWRNLMKITKIFQTSFSDPYEKAGVYLKDTGDTVQVRFRGLLAASGTGSGLTAIDEMEINEGPLVPPCPIVKNIDIISGTDTSLTISLNNSNIVNEIEWGIKGFKQGTGCALQTDGNTAVLDDCIEANEIYDLYIRNNCLDSGDGVSNWAKFSFCSPVTTPYYANFDALSTGDLPSCWTSYTSGIGSSVNEVGVVETSSLQAFSGNNVLRLYDKSNPYNDSLMLISPRLSQIRKGDKQIRFMAMSRSSNVSFSAKKLIIGTMSAQEKGSTFKAIDTIFLTHYWKEYIIPFNSGSGYNMTDQFVVIRLANGLNSALIEDFHYEEIPLCPSPPSTSLRVGFTTANSAVLAWSASGNGQYIVEWGDPGFDPGVNSKGRINTTDTSVTLKGLTAQTSYEFYVQDSCSTAGNNIWSGPYSFITTCEIIQAPFSEDFDGAFWNSTVVAYNPGNIGDGIDNCWKRKFETGTERIENSGNHWAWGVQNQQTSPSTGPSTDNSGSGNYIFIVPGSNIQNLDTIRNETADIYTPVIDVSGLNDPYLSFYYHRYGDLMPDVKLEVNTGHGWETALSFAGEQQTSGNAPYKKAGLKISSYGDTLQFRFTAQATGGPGLSKMAIDDFVIDEAPACPDISNLYTSHVLDTAGFTWSTVLSWSGDTAVADYYEVSWGAPGFFEDSTLYSNKTMVNGTDLIMDTLGSAKCYEFVVRAFCKSGGSSAYQGPFSFCTPCHKKKAPYLENFNTFFDIDGENLGNCWDQEFKLRSGMLPNQAYRWKSAHSSTNTFTGPDHDATGNGKYLYTQVNGQMGDEAVLYSPMVDITSLQKPEMYFAYHMFGSDIDTLHIDIFDGLLWYEDIIVMEGQQQTSKGEAWKDTTLDLTSYKANNLVQLRFRAMNSGTYGEIAIDDFRVSDSITCPFPANFMMTTKSDSTATLSWTSEAGSQDFIVEYGVKGYSYGEGTEITTTDNHMIITVPDNRLYDAYIRSNCGGGDSSYVIGPVAFQSEVVPCDDMEAYHTGSLKGQSALFQSWNGPIVGFDSDLDEEIDNSYSTSGTQSLHIYEGPKGGSSVLASFEGYSSGVYKVGFSIFVPDTGGGIYSFSNNGGEMNNELFFFDQNSGMCNVIWASPNANIGSFPFKTGWSHISHIFDLDRDTVWMLVNGEDIGLGWKEGNYSSRSPGFNSMRFNTTYGAWKDTSDFSEYYIDDFCISPYECPVPAGLSIDNAFCTKAILSWISALSGTTTIIEYDTTGFVKGNGYIMETTGNTDTIPGLVPGNTYDVYVGEVCGYDTLFAGPVTFTLPTKAVADFTLDKGTIVNGGLTVDFDASSSIAASDYSWDFGDSTTASGKITSHTYSANGEYQVKLIIESDCGNDTISKTVKISGIDMEDNILNNTLKVYPNPFSSKVQISFETQSSDEGIFRLLDLSGKVIWQKKINHINGKYEGEVDLSDLPKGSYMLRVEAGEITAVKRIIKN